MKAEGRKPLRHPEMATGAVMVSETSSRSVGAIFVRKPVAAASAIILLVIIAGVLLAPVLAPYGPDEQDLYAVFQLPSIAHPLGTGELGLDILSRLMYGGQITLLSTLTALTAFVLVGVSAGMLAGYHGGRFDQFVLKSADIAFAIPGFIVLLIVLAIFPGNEILAMAVWGILGSPGLARIVRAATLGVREELFVRAAAASGLRDGRIVVRHILPAVAGIVIGQASVFASGAVITESGLGFLGLGTKSASWGNLISEASAYLGSDPWLLVPSGALIILFIIALNFVADGLRDSLAQRHTPVARRPRRLRRRPTSPNTPIPAEAAGLSPRESAVLSVRGLSVALRIEGEQTPVVTDVSFDVLPGEAHGIVGESGCGKTITAVSLLGLLPAEGQVVAGSIRFQGIELTTATPRGLRAIRGARIGWVSQDPVASLDPSFTAGYQVATAIRAHTSCSRKEAKRRTLELFARVKLPDPERVWRSYPHQLSGGMAQRVGIAAALACGPELIVADEPTTALDVTVQAEILDVLRGLKESGTALILITHDWGVLADLCDSASVMYAGQIVETGDVEELVAAPRHPYTIALVKSDPTRAQVGVPLPVLRGSVPPPLEWPKGCRFQNRCSLVVDECRAGTIALRSIVDRGGSSRCIRVDDLTERAPA